MKKSLLRIIALNLAVLMLLSFPFCAFAEEVAELQVGEVTIPNENGEGATIDATFIPQQSAIYKLTAPDEALELYDANNALMGSFGMYYTGSILFYGEAGVSYRVRMEDYGNSGYIYTLELYENENPLPESGVEKGVNYYYGAAQDKYAWFNSSEVRIYDETSGEYSEQEGLVYRFTAGHVYCIEFTWVGNKPYQLLDTPMAYRFPSANGEENPAGVYAFSLSESGYYIATSYLEDCTAEHYLYIDEDRHQYAFRRGNTYYFYAEQPFALERQEPSEELIEGLNEILVNEAGETEWTFIPAKAAVWAFQSRNTESATAIYQGDTLLGSTNGKTPLMISLQEGVEYRVSYYAIEPSVWEVLEIVGYSYLNAYQAIPAGYWAYIPSATAYYDLGAYSSVWSVETGASIEKELGVFPLEGQKTYLIYADALFDVYKVDRTYGTPKTDKTENEAGYYKFTPAEDGRYFASVELTGLESGDAYADGTYAYNLSAGETYVFYADQAFTLFMDNALKTGENMVDSSKEGTTNWTFTPTESGWYSVDLEHSGATIELFLGEQSQGRVENYYEPLYVKLQADAEYTVAYTAEFATDYNYITIEKVTELDGEQGTVEGDEYDYLQCIIEPEQDGYYVISGSYGGVFDLETGSDISSEIGPAYHLYAGKVYRVSAWGKVFYRKMGAEMEYLPLELTEEKVPAGFYSFTPQKSGTYWSSAYLSGEGIITEGNFEIGYGYKFYKGETYKFYSESEFEFELMPTDPALKLGWNVLFMDEVGTTNWTYTPAESGWHRFYNDSYNTVANIYADGEPLAAVGGGEDLNFDANLYLTAGVTYDVTYTTTVEGNTGSIYIEYYKPLYGLPDEMESGTYAISVEESGYYTFGPDYRISIYDTANNCNPYSENGAYYMIAGVDYLTQPDSTFSLERINPQAPSFDGSENPAGYYLITPEALTTYSFSAYMVFEEYLEYTVEEDWYVYTLAAGNSYIVYSAEAFTATAESFNGALKEGYNAIGDFEGNLTFTPAESGWYYFTAPWQVRVYEDDASAVDDLGYGYLTAGVTYTALTEAEELWITKYKALALGEAVAESGQYVFTPAESGNYYIEQDYLYDTLNKVSVEGYIGEFTLEAGVAYLMYAEEGSVISRSDRVYRELTLAEGENPAGFYTFTPAEGGRYAFGKDVLISLGYECEYDEPSGTYRVSLPAGGTYLIYAAEDFTFAKIPFGELSLGYNEIFGERGENIAMTFTPAESGYYAFEINGNEMKIYNGEQLIKDLDAEETMALLELEGGTEYRLVYRYNEYIDIPYVTIIHPTVLTDTEGWIPYGSYLFTPTESGWYQYGGMHSMPYDIEAGVYCPIEMGACALEAGKTYFIRDMGETIFKEDRTYIALTISEDQKAAGYYTFVAPRGGYYTSTTLLSFGNCSYMEYGFDEQLQKYVYAFHGGSEVRFYASEAFYIASLEVDRLVLGANRVFADAGEQAERTFTPAESGLYKIYAWEGSMIEIYQGEQLVAEALSQHYLQLSADTTYRVVFEKNLYDDDDEEVIEVSFYQALVFANGNEYYGSYAFTPEQSGYYRIQEYFNVPYDVTLETYVENESGEFRLEAGHTYLMDIAGTITFSGEREYVELTIDDQVKPAGYYQYNPTHSAAITISAAVEGLYDWYYKGDEIVYNMYAGNSYKFYVPEAFTVSELPKSIYLNVGTNYIYDEVNTVATYTFVPDEDGWYEIGSMDNIDVYRNGEKLLGVEDGWILAELEAGGDYTVVISRAMDPNYANPAIYIEYYKPITDISAVENGAWQFSVDQSGYYAVHSECTIFDAEAMEPVGDAMGERYLESGKEYLITVYEYIPAPIEITFVGQREYTELTLDGEEKAAGYYVFSADKYTFLATSAPIEGTIYFYDKIDGWYVYWCGKTDYYFYADQSFYAKDFGEFVYSENDDGTISIFEFTGNTQEIEVPATIDGKAVKSVALIGLLMNLWPDKAIVKIAEGIEEVVEPYDDHSQIRLLELNSTAKIKKAQFAPDGQLVLVIPAGRTDMDIFDSAALPNITHIFYGGTAEQWEVLKATDSTGVLANAIVHTESTAADYTVEKDGEDFLVLCNHCGSASVGCLHETTVDGYDPCNIYWYEKCAECEEILDYEYLGEENATHSFGNVVVTKRATCKEAGAGYKVCARCETKVNVTIDKLTTHTPGETIVDKAPTCGKAGVGHKNCVDCGQLAQSNVTVPATGNHTAGALVTDKAPTCTKAGSGHKNCTVCGKVAQSGIAIPATGVHKAGNWKTTKKATYDAAGLDTKYCVSCGKVMGTRAVAKLVKAAVVFEDVKADDWYHDAVSYAYSNNLFKGVSEDDFAPAQEMTRAMLVTVLWRYAGEPVGGKNPFVDVPAGQWYTEAVAWAANNGVVNGMDATHFAPDATISREQMATILYRFAKSTGLSISGSANIGSFQDGSKVNGWAKEGMQWAVGKGLINGSSINGTVLLDPANGATRGQVATILMRYIENIVKA